MRVDEGPPVDVFATVHRLGAPFTDFPGYRPVRKTVAAHPILADLALAAKSRNNPWRRKIAGAREVRIEAGKNLSYNVRSFEVARGEAIRLTLVNPDVVPHNWVLARPGTLAAVGDLANRIIADPEAVVRHYVPETRDVLAYTDMVGPQDQFTIDFRAPNEPGDYPYLCTFPGHWMVMNGLMVVR
jgi:azurin